MPREQAVDGRTMLPIIREHHLLGGIWDAEIRCGMGDVAGFAPHVPDQRPDCELVAGEARPFAPQAVRVGHDRNLLHCLPGWGGAHPGSVPS